MRLPCFGAESSSRQLISMDATSAPRLPRLLRGPHRVGKKPRDLSSSEMTAEESEGDEQESAKFKSVRGESG